MESITHAFNMSVKIIRSEGQQETNNPNKGLGSCLSLQAWAHPIGGGSGIKEARGSYNLASK